RLSEEEEKDERGVPGEAQTQRRDCLPLDRKTRLCKPRVGHQKTQAEAGATGKKAAQSHIPTDSYLPLSLVLLRHGRVPSSRSFQDLCYKHSMPQKSLLVLGLMSGTSADGVEAALAEISGAPPRLHSKLVGHTSFPFPKAVRTKILEIAEGAHVPAGEISQLNFRLGGLFGDVAIAACKKFGVSLKRLDLIASHGQTVFHQGPSRKVASGGWRVAKNVASTLQLGDGSVIANLAGVATVSDFRPADMAAGGQGAPLVPFAEYLLYRDEKAGRVALDLGGVSHVTGIPPRSQPATIVALDTAPAYMMVVELVS